MRTWIELNSSHFHHNITRLFCALKAQNRHGLFGLVLKSNAYGHGLHEIASLAKNMSEISWFFAGDLDEALELRAAGIQGDILSFSLIGLSLARALSADISVALNQKEDLAIIAQTAQALGVSARVHIKVETGLSRLGVMPHEVVDLFAAAAAQPSVRIEGIFTHLAQTETSDLNAAHQQLSCFSRVQRELRAAGYAVPLSHALGSGGLSLVVDEYPLIRVGTSAYGFYKSSYHQERLKAYGPIDLKPVMTWKTTIYQIKEVPCGTFVGYARTFVAPRPTRLAVLPVGYFDGYARSLTNKGWVMIHGQRAPVVGVVSMNLTTVDVTDIPEARIGSPVVLLGVTPEPEAGDLAALCSTIDREIITRINPLIKRIIVD